MSKTYLFFLLVAFISTPTFATPAAAGNRPQVSLGDDENYLRLEPIIGVQQIYRDRPTGHNVTQTILGARLVYGQQVLAGELEYTQGYATEKFTSPPEKIQTKSEQFKLGVRSTLPFLDYFSLTGRAGGQATRGKVDETNNGVVTSTDIPMKVYPYAGASLGLHLSRFLTVSAGSVVVFRNGLNMTKNDIQNYVSFSIGI